MITGMATPSAQFSLTLRVALPSRPGGVLGKVTAAIARAGGSIVAVDTVDAKGDRTIREITVECCERRPPRPGDLRRPGGDGGRGRGDHRPHLRGPPARQDPHRAEPPAEDAATTSRWPTRRASRACARAIAENRQKAFKYTIKANTVAVVSDGTAVLGLGDIGPEAAMPVMEGKAMLFKEFADVDAFPICLDHEGRGRDRGDRDPHRPHLRRHQPRGHLLAALLRDRAAAPGGARHPRLPRRPARHRDRDPRRADQRLPPDRPHAWRTSRC